MGLGDMIDAAIEPFAPETAARRRAARMTAGLLQRQFDAAKPTRQTKGWRRPKTDANAANQQGLVSLRASGWDLYRNNKHAHAGVNQMVANIIGDGILPQFQHSDPKVIEIARGAWDRWAESKVDGHSDFYGYQRTAMLGTIVGGETLSLWKPGDGKPNGRVEGLEGDYLDHSRTADLDDGGVILQGVEFDRNNDRRNYWLFDRHPGGLAVSRNHTAKPISATNVDHVFRRSRFGEVRGTSWLAPVILTLRDVQDIEDAARTQQKIQACLGLILSPGEGAGASPLLGEGNGADQSLNPQTGVLEETVRPGMIFRARPGETVQTINPTQAGGAVEFMRQQLASVAANMVPYHVLTGDVSQANYSSLRASFLAFWAMLDDHQQHCAIPMLVAPAVQRRLQLAALETGNRAVLDVKVTYALPVRRFVDPVKDLMAEIMEIRAGLKQLDTSLAERGIHSGDHMIGIAKMNKIIDDLGLALDSDPRRLTDSGVLQAAAGYLAPRGQQ